MFRVSINLRHPAITRTETESARVEAKNEMSPKGREGDWADELRAAEQRLTKDDVKRTFYEKLDTGYPGQNTRSA